MEKIKKESGQGIGFVKAYNELIPEYSAEVIGYSISPTGREIVTYRLQYPRIILAELNTHRVFSRNSASTRAVPILEMVKRVYRNTVDFVHWGLNQSGMVANEEATGYKKTLGKLIWNATGYVVASSAFLMSKLGIHKQVGGRMMEPWTWMQTIVTSTEWDNFFELRNHSDAQPEIQMLAKLMLEAKKYSTPVNLDYGQWHLPGINTVKKLDSSDVSYYVFGETTNPLSLEDARIISSSICAQVSYRKNDSSLEKAKAIFKRLIESKPVHASPIEHQATPLDQNQYETWEDGVTHQDRNGVYWSGNFRGWIQWRQLIKI